VTIDGRLEPPLIVRPKERDVGALLDRVMDESWTFLIRAKKRSLYEDNVTGLGTPGAAFLTLLGH